MYALQMTAGQTGPKWKTTKAHYRRICKMRQQICKMRKRICKMRKRICKMKQQFAKWNSEFAKWDSKLAQWESEFPKWDNKFAKWDSICAKWESDFAHEKTNLQNEKANLLNEKAKFLTDSFCTRCHFGGPASHPRGPLTILRQHQQHTICFPSHIVPNVANTSNTQNASPHILFLIVPTPATRNMLPLTFCF